MTDTITIEVVEEITTIEDTDGLILQSIEETVVLITDKGEKGDPGGVQSVTGLNTDNTDPANPIIQISVDGTTISGLGTPASPLVSSGGSPIFSNLTADKTVQNNESGYRFTNLGASSIVNIDFSAATAPKEWKFIVQDAVGFNLVNPGTFYFSGMPYTVDILSTMIGSIVTATKISSTEVALEVTGPWEPQDA